jgi:hypothetical protein
MKNLTNRIDFLNSELKTINIESEQYTLFSKELEYLQHNLCLLNQGKIKPEDIVL